MWIVFVVVLGDVVVVDDNDIVGVIDHFQHGHSSIRMTTIEAWTKKVDPDRHDLGPSREKSLDPLGTDRPCRHHKQQRLLWQES